MSQRVLHVQDTTRQTGQIALSGYWDRTHSSRWHVRSNRRRITTLWSSMTQLLLSIRSTHICFSHLPSVEVISSFHDIEDRTKCWEEPLDLVNDKSTHIHNLRPFNYDPARTSPLAIAQQNEQEFVVESINGHRGNRQRRSTMEFKTSHAIVGSTPACQQAPRLSACQCNEDLDPKWNPAYLHYFLIHL